VANVTVVVGAQFGSEGKGAICGHLGKKMDEADLAIRVAGPNAGHTVYGADHTEWKLRAVPVAAVTSRDCGLHIAAGSEIDVEVLLDEVNRLDEAGYHVTDRLTIHPSATILSQRHKTAEMNLGLVGRIGSTGKGIGAARADRIMRAADTASQLTGVFGSKDGSRQWLDDPIVTLEDYGHVVIEGTQGYGLGLHTKFYPQVTSSDCRAIDFLAMAGISPWSENVDALRVILVARMYPIRVAGNSGPLKNETSWEELGLPLEHTTVTNKVRRVGDWDQALVTDAIRCNGGGDYNPNVVLALTMIDQRFPDNRDKTDLDDAAFEFVNELEEQLRTEVAYAGTGPETVVEL